MSKVWSSDSARFPLHLATSAPNRRARRCATRFIPFATQNEQAVLFTAPPLAPRVQTHLHRRAAPTAGSDYIGLYFYGINLCGKHAADDVKCAPCQTA